MRWRAKIRCLAAAALVLAVCAVPRASVSSRPAPILEQSALDSLEQVNTLINTGSLNDAALLIEPIKRRAIAARDTFVMARVLAQEARVSLMQSRVSAAEGLARESIDLSMATRDTAAWVIGLGWLAWATNMGGRSDESMELGRRRLELSEASGNLSSAAWAHVTIAFLSLMNGEYPAARAHYTRAIETFDESGNQIDMLTPLIGLGRVNHNLGDIDAARDAYKRVWALSRELGNSENEAHAVNNLGTIEYDSGNPALAAQLFQRAHDIHYQAGWYNETITPLNNVAMCHTYLGRFDEAQRVLESALAVIDEHELASRRAEVLEEVGVLHQQRGEENAALLAFSQAQEGSPPGTRVYGNAAASIAGVHMKAGRYAEALASLNRALAVGDALPARQRFNLRVIKADVHVSLGEPDQAVAIAEAILGDVAETDPGYSTLYVKVVLSRAYRALDDGGQSRRWLDEAMALAESRRAEISEDAWKEGVGHHTNLMLVGAAAVLLEYPIAASDAERCATFFDIVERSRARTLVERIGRRHDLTQTSPASMAHLQKDVLEDGEVLLEFITSDHGDFVIAVSPDACRAVELTRGDVIRDRTDLYYRMMGTSAAPMSDALHHMHMKSSATLGRLLMSGVADILASATRIFVVTDGYFASVPFAALSLPDSDTMLMEAAEVIHVPSATVLTIARDQRPETTTGEVLVVMPSGDHDLAGAITEVAQLQRTIRDVEMWARPANGVDAGAELADYKVLHVAAHVDVNNERPWYSTIRLEGVRPKPPSRSRSVSPLLAASPEQMAAFNAEFHAAPGIRAIDVAGWRLRARLAVLSGCESAGGRASTGEGVIGLTSAFLSAGVPTVVATLWPIDDAITADLMAAFYTQLVEGKTVAGALRLAQLSVRARPATRHPFFWAGFVVVGDGAATVDLTEKTTSSIWVYAIVALAGLLIGGTVGMLNRRKKAENSQDRL